METSPELAQYIVSHYGRFMTGVEWRAQRHLHAAMKATQGKSDVEAQAKAEEHRVHSKFLSNEPEVLTLTSEGYEKFVERTAARILNEHRDELFFNYCPKCGQLARTPTAKQCRFCRHDWH